MDNQTNKENFQAIRKQLIDNPKHPNKTELVSKLIELTADRGRGRIENLHRALNFGTHRLDLLNIWERMLVHKEIAAILKAEKEKTKPMYCIEWEIEIKVMEMLYLADAENYEKRINH